MARLGRYEILEQMGTGAMGNVYRARDADLDREVAIKTIRTGVDVDPEVRQRFYREARACARLQHPNIITVFDLGEVENTAYIVMELLNGADFRRIIQERRSISIDLKLAAAAGVCDALAHAHRHGVIHRDIKPSNLFLTSEGLAKVLDFGIARLPSSKLTVAGQILGTPNYMAPEQILARNSDARADLFSAAVVFFELLTYAHPFQGSLVPRRIVQSEPDSLFDYDAGLPVILDKVFARGLAKDPDHRYQTGDELAADLRTVLDAIRGNASPGYSGIYLPSERVVHVLQPPSGPSATGVVPEGQDPQEWRLSEALRLLPEFEAAVERRDIASAQTAVTELETRLAGDIRFQEAIRLCHSRISELMSAAVSPPVTADVRVQSATANAGERHLAHQRPQDSADANSLDLGATIFAAGPPTVLDAPAPPELPLSSASQRTPTADPVPYGPAGQIMTEKPRSLLANIRRKRVITIAAGVLICAILLLIAVIAVLRPQAVQPAVATAIVNVGSANLLATPSSAAKRIGTVSRGTRLNILRLPTAPDQEWVNAQEIRPRVSRPGFIRIAQLREWRGQTGADDLALVRMFSSGESGNELEIKSEIQRLNELIAHFRGDSAAQEAQLDIAGLRIAWAERYGSSTAESESELRSAQKNLQDLRGESRLERRVMELNQQIDALMDRSQGLRQQEQPAVPKALPDVSQLLVTAKRFRLDGDYLGAEKLLERVLVVTRDKEATTLLNKIRRARDVEQGGQHQSAAAVRKMRRSGDDFLSPVSGPLTLLKLSDLVRLMQPDIETEGRILRVVEARSVDFLMSPANAEALVTAGASPKILELLRRKAPPPPPPKAASPVKEERRHTGTLRIECEPIECEFAVGGGPFSSTAGGVAVIPSLGEVTVSIRRLGYLEQHRTVVVSPDQQTDVAVKLSPDAQTRIVFGTRLFEALMNASGRRANQNNATGVFASGSATFFDAEGAATEWNITVGFNGIRGSFTVKNSSGEMKLECNGETCRPQGGIRLFSKHPNRDQMQTLETTLRQFQMYHFSALLDRFAASKMRASADAASVPPHGEQQLQLQGDSGVYKISLNPDSLPTLVTLDSKTGVGSGLRVAFSDYGSVGMLRYPRTTEMKFPGGKQGIRVRFDNLKPVNTK